MQTSNFWKPLTHEFQDIFIWHVGKMVESFAVFRLGFSQLEDSELVDWHVTDLAAPAA